MYTPLRVPQHLLQKENIEEEGLEKRLPTPAHSGLCRVLSGMMESIALCPHHGHCHVITTVVITTVVICHSHQKEKAHQ